MTVAVPTAAAAEELLSMTAYLNTKKRAIFTYLHE